MYTFMVLTTLWLLSLPQFNHVEHPVNFPTVACVNVMENAAEYYEASEIILLHCSWDIANIEDRSTFVHELTHHIQKMAGNTYNCGEEREKEAYEIEDMWRKEHNLPSYIDRLDPLMYFFATTCQPSRGIY